MYVEILRKISELSDKDIIMLITMYIDSQNIKSNVIVRCNSITVFDICDHIEEFSISGTIKIPLQISETKFRVYTFNKQGPEIETIVNGDDGEEILASNHWMLPSAEFRGLYESLIFEDGVKEKLLNYVETIMLFSSKGVDSNLIACNRLVLLHGPPGTGKTSLCKAIAQKLAIKLLDFKYTHLIEINSHSLFSKWFSESGKLVMKLFEKIKEIVQHKQSLVCVLVDEVESIAFARNAVGSNEPSDSLRVVNAVLTQLDQIRHYPNVLILTTSNLTSAIDVAFIDRADIKQYIGNPQSLAIYKIYTSAIEELMRVNIIADSYKFIETNNIEDNDPLNVSFTLLKIAEKSSGFSGRTLRKIPFLAYTRHLQKSDLSKTLKLADYLVVMDEIVMEMSKDTGESNKVTSANR